MDERVKKKVFEAVSTEEETALTGTAKIVFDQKQYSVRIPMKVARQVGLNPDKHIMEFKAIPNDEGTSFSLVGVLKEE